MEFTNIFQGDGREFLLPELNVNNQTSRVPGSISGDNC